MRRVSRCNYPQLRIPAKGWKLHWTARGRTVFLALEGALVADTPIRNRVLIVDDDAAVRETLRRLLAAAGFDVMVVTTGEEALMTLHHDPTIGLMLLDIQMPGMNGLAVRRAQLADPAIAEIPAVIVSGSFNAAIEVSALGAEFLQKPVARVELLAVVARHCRPIQR